MPERFVPNSPEWRIGGLQHLQRYAFATDRIAGRRILDLACGPGYGSYVLAQAAGREVVGVDISPEAIAYGKQHYRRPGLELAIGDALTWTPPDGLFDTVVCFETIEHLADPRAFVAHLTRLLSPSGRLIISAPNTLQHLRAPEPIPNPFHLNEPDYATLVDWLTPAFEIESEWEQSPVLHPALGLAEESQALLLTLNRRWWLRAANRIENLLRRVAHPTPLPPRRRSLEPLLASTAIFPLLPERREACEVFIFVCRCK